MGSSVTLLNLEKSYRLRKIFAVSCYNLGRKKHNDARNYFNQKHEKYQTNSILVGVLP